MKKEEVRIEGDRYLIYYWFDNARTSPPNDQRQSKSENKLSPPMTRSSNETEEIVDKR